MTLRFTATRSRHGFNRVRYALQHGREFDSLDLPFALVDAIRALFHATTKAIVQVADGDGGTVVIAWRPKVSWSGIPGREDRDADVDEETWAVEIDTGDIR